MGKRDNVKMNQYEERVFNWLEDEESRFIYKKRIEYRKSHDIAAIYEICERYLQEWGDYNKRRAILLDILKSFNKVFVFGAGKRGEWLEKCYLFNSGIKISGWLDNHPDNSTLPNVSLPGQCVEQNACYIITPLEPEVSIMFRQLLELGIDSKNIIRFMDYMPGIWAQWEKQYFDTSIIIDFGDSEVFVDAGAYDLSTSGFFINHFMANGSKKISIYAYEPVPELFDICKKKKEELESEDVKIQLFQNGLWHSDERLCFNINGDSSRIINDETGDYIDAIALDDSVLDRVTFIKMDIEGAELEALRGAKKIIKRWKPRLAICIYHRPEDLVDIPMYIKELVPEYRLYIRHYSNFDCETVLFAVI